MTEAQGERWTESPKNHHLLFLLLTERIYFLEDNLGKRPSLFNSSKEQQKGEESSEICTCMSGSITGKVLNTAKSIKVGTSITGGGLALTTTLNCEMGCKQQPSALQLRKQAIFATLSKYLPSTIFCTHILLIFNIFNKK